MRWGCLDFSLSSNLSSFFLSLSQEDNPIYRPKYCLKSPSNPKQPSGLSNALGQPPTYMLTCLPTLPLAKLVRECCWQLLKTWMRASTKHVHFRFTKKIFSILVWWFIYAPVITNPRLSKGNSRNIVFFLSAKPGCMPCTVVEIFR